MAFRVEHLLLYLAPVFVLCIALEWYYQRRTSGLPDSARYTLIDASSNAMLALMYKLGELLTVGFILLVYDTVFGYRLLDLAFTPLTLFLLFILQDFLYYWFHRASHNIRWLWAAHVVHHSSETMNFSTAFRQSLMYPIAGMWLFWIPLVVLGFSPGSVLVMVAISLAYQFFIHTQTVQSLGWLEWIVNTPRHHCLHHARNPRYIDNNFGGTLIIWDRLFGTYVEAIPEEPIRYGIRRPVHSHNPLVLTFHEWHDMLADFQRARGVRGQLEALFGPPP